MANRTKQDLSKAEIVRQRRKQQGKERSERKVQRAHEMPVIQNTPIFVRRGTMGTPVVQRTRTHVKRKIALPLQSGSEVVIPGLPMVRLGWRALSGFLSISLLVFLLMINLSSILDIDEISVIGLQRVNPVDVSNVLNLKGQPIYTVSPQTILERIEATFPEFYNVEVAIGFPKSVSIVVQERQPVIAWQYENLTMWIDAEGNIFPSRGTVDGLISIIANTAPPRLQIPMTDEEIKIARAENELADDQNLWLKDGPVDPDLVQKVLYLQNRMPQITQLSFYIKDGFGWHDGKNDWNVYFGHNLDDLDQKLLVYEQIKKWILDNQIHPDMISVAYLRAPYYRLEQ
jgi:cell division protein FtsQ